MLTQIWSVKDIIFCHFRPFFALFPLYWPQKSIFWKNKKKGLEILAFHTCVPQMTVIWCMVPEILSATDIIFGHFELFLALLLLPPNNPENQNFVKIKNTWRYHHFTKVYLKWQSYNIWFQWYEVQQDFFCHFGPYFCPFTPLTNQKIKMLKKWRKKHLEISSFYTNVTKILIILYCSWDMVHDASNSYFSFWAIFWPLTP